MSILIAFRDSSGEGKLFKSNAPLHNKTQQQLKDMVREQLNIIAKLPILVEVG